MIRRKEFLLTVLTVFLASCTCLMLYQFDNKYTHKGEQPISGVLYLSEKDLTENPIIFPVREWELMPNVLLTPQEQRQYNGYRRYLDLGGSVGIDHGSGTYHLTLMLPENEASYALELPEVFSACKLYINDKLMLQLGNPSVEEYREGIASRVVPFTASGKTEILLAVSDFSGIYSGLTYPPAFGYCDAVLRLREFRILLHGGAVLLSMLGIALTFAFGMRGNRWRGVLCCMVCLCLLGVVGYPLFHGIFITGFQPWYTLEAACYYGLLLLAVLLQCELYEIQPKTALMLSIPCGVGILCAVVYLGGTAFLGDWWGSVFSLLSVCLKFYAASCLIGLSGWALFMKKRYSMPLMCASITLAVCLVFDRLLPLYEPLYGGWFGEIGGVLLAAALGTSLWLDALDAYRFRLAYEGSYRQMERRLSMEKEHYQQLSEQIQRSQEAAHDLRHHMRTLRGIANGGQIDRLTAYLNSYEPHLAERELTIWSDHPVADTIISHYATAAKHLDAVYDVRLAIPPSLPFPDDELCILLGNMLENAIEALERQKEGPRRLYLRGDFNNGRLGIVLDNSFNGVINVRSGKYISMKHGGLGLGISSVRAIAEKYGGLTDFSADGHTFHASLMIPLSETSDT